MTYKTWNSRLLPFFREELMEEDHNTTYPSIEAFREKDIYTRQQRSALQQYLAQCPCIVASSYRRRNAYSGIETFELAYYTDGEVIFNNFLLDYIGQEDFALPIRWLDKITGKNYTPPGGIDIDALLHSGTDIFRMSTQTFAAVPLIRPFLQ